MEWHWKRAVAVALAVLLAQLLIQGIRTRPKPAEEEKTVQALLEELQQEEWDLDELKAELEQKTRERDQSQGSHTNLFRD